MQLLRRRGARCPLRGVSESLHYLGTGGVNREKTKENEIESKSKQKPDYLICMGYCQSSKKKETFSRSCVMLQTY